MKALTGESMGAEQPLDGASDPEKKPQNVTLATLHVQLHLF